MRRAALAVVALALLAACARSQQQQVGAASQRLARAVRRGDDARTVEAVLPGARGTLDRAALLGPNKRAWARRLARPRAVLGEADVLLAEGLSLRVVSTPQGWRLGADPTDLYAQDTPEAAIAALVRASRRGRWDVLLRLAPRRYRVGLSAEDLQAAWTEGEQAAQLAAARDRLAAHVGDPVPHDDHEARLELGGGHAVRLEREDGAWVIVDF
ncbi:MAG: hypothetical protein K1X88_21685 [Nannocystaceae bacterium]|nr:hypothetical protein [Nannocystaceae bacterium]